MIKVNTVLINSDQQSDSQSSGVNQEPVESNLFNRLDDVINVIVSNSKPVSDTSGSQSELNIASFTNTATDNSLDDSQLQQEVAVNHNPEVSSVTDISANATNSFNIYFSYFLSAGAISCLGYYVYNRIYNPDYV